MTTTERQRRDMMLNELTAYEGPYAFLERFADRRARKERRRPITVHVTDMSIIIDGITHWAVIGCGMPTSLNSTLDALSDLKTLTWDECNVKYDVMTREVVVRIETRQSKAA